MNEFLRQHYFLVTHSVEILAASTGIFFYKKYRSTVAKYFIYFLIYVACIDFLGRYPDYFRMIDRFNIIEGTFIESNYWWYAIFWSIGFPAFLSYLNIGILKTSIYLKFAKFISYLFLLLVLLYLLYDIQAIFNTANIFLSVLSGLVIAIQSSVYFFGNITDG